VFYLLIDVLNLRYGRLPALDRDLSGVINPESFPRTKVIKKINSIQSFRFLDEYKTLHDSMTNFKHERPRYFVYASGAGLGNIELGLLSSYLIAILTDRAIINAESLTSGILDTPFENGVWNEWEGKTDPRFTKLSSKKYSMSNGECFGDNIGFGHKLAEQDLDEVFREDVIYFASNCPLFRWISRNPRYTPKLKKWGFIPSDATNTPEFGFFTASSVASLLFNLKPTVQTTVDDWMNDFRKGRPNSLFISAQIRLGRVKGGGDVGIEDIYISPNDIPSFWNCVEALSHGRPFTLFLAVDNDWVVGDAQDRFGKNNVVYIPGAIAHIQNLNAESQELTKVILDHWIQGEADELIITAGSTFGSMAAIRGGKLPFYITKNKNCTLASMELGPYHDINAITW